MIMIWHALVVNPMMEDCFAVLPNVCAIFSIFADTSGLV